MADSSQHDKTEAPSQRRRERAREEGQVAQSPDFTAAMVMFLAALALRRIGPAIGAGLEQALTETLPKLSGASTGFAETMVWARWLGGHLVLITGAAVAGVMAVGLLTSGLQAGFRVTPNAISFKWERLSPVSGWGRLFSLDGTFRGVNTLMKLTLALSIGIYVIANRWAELRFGSQGTLRNSAALAWDVTAAIAISISAAALLWAAGDYLFRWWRHEQQLRMSKQELKDEAKNDDGNPQLRSRMRNVHKQAAARKALKQVPEATVVITNPTHVAVAIKYTVGQPGAPRVIAKGTGALAQRIKRIAKENGVPIHEMKPLARALYRQVNIGQEIPVELYHVVAEILSKLYRRRRAG